MLTTHLTGMFEETTPRNSSKWRPHTTFASDMGLTPEGRLEESVVMNVERKGSTY